MVEEVQYLVYGSDECPWCLESAYLLFSKGVKYEERIAKEYMDSPVLSKLKKEDVLKKNKQGDITIPIIIKWDLESNEQSYIGGYEELKQHLEESGR